MVVRTKEQVINTMCTSNAASKHLNGEGNTENAFNAAVIPCSSSILPKGPRRGCRPLGTRIAPPPFPPIFLAADCSIRLEEEDTLLSGPIRIGNLSAAAPVVA